MKELFGTTLDENYDIQRTLGKGRLGTVHVARDAALDHDVAIKVVHPELADDPSFRARFLQEVWNVAALDHPGIARLHACGQEMLYIVMDLLPGQALDAWLKHLSADDQLISLVESLAIARQVAQALHYAHRQGVLHGDVKPSNILFRPADPVRRASGDLPYRPVLTDFALAMLAENEAGLAADALAYMSPEQCLGMALEARSDVYSLGVVLYEMVTGRVPFEVDSLAEAVHRHTEEAPPSPRAVHPSLPAEVELILLQALAKRPEDRFATAGEMAGALTAVLPRLLTGPAMEGRSRVSLMSLLAEGSVAPESPEGERARAAAEPISPQDAALTVVTPDGSSRRIPLESRRSLTVGRSRGNDIRLEDARVSRYHTRVEFDGEGWVVVDLNSSNGTFLDQLRLSPGEGHPWSPGVPLRIGKHSLLIGMEGVPSEKPPSVGEEAVVLESEVLTVDAGQRAAARLHVHNPGEQAEQFFLAVDGVSPSWFTLPTDPVDIPAQGQEVISITFHPPRAPRSAAGPHPFTVRVIPKSNPREVIQLVGTLDIRSFHDLAVELRPQQVTAGRARLEMENRGNVPTSLNIAAGDPAEALRVQTSSAQLTLRPGERQTVPLSLSLKGGRPLLGAAQNHPFQVTVTPHGGRAIAESGSLVVRPYIPIWALPAVAVPLIVLAIVFSYLFARKPTIRSVIVDPPAPQAGEPVTVRWEIDKARQVDLLPVVNGLDPSAKSYTVQEGFEAPASLTLVASNRFGEAQRTVDIDIVAPARTPTAEPDAPVLLAWDVYPTQITMGQSVTITWRVNNAESVTLHPFGTVDIVGQVTDRPQETKTYILVATNRGKTMRRSQEVVVAEPLPPVAANDAYTVLEGDMRTVYAPGVLANDGDAEGDPLTAVLVDTVRHGTLTLDPNGSFTYTHDGSANHSDHFTYKARDDDGDSNVATVSLSVTEENDAPALDNTGSPHLTAIEEDDLDNSGTSVPDLIGRLGGSRITDQDANALQGIAVINANTGHGTWQYTTNGTTWKSLSTPSTSAARLLAAEANTRIRFQPSSDFSGKVDPAITFRAWDQTTGVNGNTANTTSNGGSTAYSGATETASIEVRPVNDDPTAADDSASTGEDTVLNVNAPGVLDNDSDPEGDSLTVATASVSGPANGSLTLNADGAFTYTPDPDYFGVDSFVYEVCDDGTPSECDMAAVNITVTPVNDPPDAIYDRATVSEGRTVTVLDSGYTRLTENDTDPEMDALEVTTSPVSGPSNGTLTLKADGTFSYTHGGSETTSDSFEYEVCDDGTPSECDIATVNITVIPVNDPPDAVNDSDTTGEDTPVLVDVLYNDHDVDASLVPSSVTVVSPPANGSTKVDPVNGVITYTPNAKWNGLDSFVYEVCDDGTPLPAECSTATVSVTVTGDNDPPDAVDDSATVDKGGTVTVLDSGYTRLTQNDTDPEKDALEVTTFPVSGPSNGTLTLKADGTFSYTHDGSETTSDSFEYEVCDDGTPSECDTATVNITVTPGNGPPDAVDDSATVNEGGTVTGKSAAQRD